MSRISGCGTPDPRESRELSRQNLARHDPSRFYLPAYIGPRGWVGIRLDRAGVDWPEIIDFISASYEATAPKTLAARTRDIAASLKKR